MNAVSKHILFILLIYILMLLAHKTFIHKHVNESYKITVTIVCVPGSIG